MLHGAIGDRLRARVAVVRGADLLRDADRVLRAAGLTHPAAKYRAWRARSGPTRRPREHPAASRSAAARRRRGRTPHHHPELVGLGLAAFGVFLAAVLWFGFSGGPVGGSRPGGRRRGRLPRTGRPVPLGALMVAQERARRRPPVPARPRRRARRADADARHGARRRSSATGSSRSSALGLGTTGATILGVLLTIAGVLFLTGACLGAILRRSGHAVRQRAHAASSASCARRAPAEPGPISEPRSVARRRSTSSTTTRTSISDSISGPAPMLYDARARRASDAETHESQETLFDRAEPSPPTTSCRTARCCSSRSRASARTARRPSASPRRSSRASRTSASRRRSIGQISGPRVTRYELQLAPGTKVGEGREPQGRPQLRARDDRDPHPRADPGQAGGRRRGAEPRARTSSRSATSTTTCRRPRARSRSGSARTSPAPPSGPTSRGCRTS